MYSFIQPTKCTVNNRGITAICFGKYSPSSGSTCGRVKTSYMYSLKMDTLINMFADGEVRKNIYKPNADKKKVY